ncbi:subclass B1 metallo-beta-lactamase [Maribacter sp. 2-571]|uniref:subclass B1 metallo-beta-lactamase n=1 Tax=Maribacter sp. 2-571 TaxID=3417569 RepID=UPI003D345769
MRHGKHFLLLTCTMFMTMLCRSQKQTIAYNSDSLKIIALSENSFVHVSYLQTEDFGKVACNGYIYLKNGKAVVVDTPTEDAVSEALLAWVTKEKRHMLRAVVINHFHNDCLGGLQPFHDAGIASYANIRTIALAAPSGSAVPLHGFSDVLWLNIGGSMVENRFLGAAHTSDNICTYVSDETLLFGGCMVKSMNATKGFLGDADTDAWSETIAKIQHTYPDLKTVIPGHGESGGTELLQYTEQLFLKK